MADSALQLLEDEKHSDNSLLFLEDRLLLSYERYEIIATDEITRRRRFQIYDNMRSLKSALKKEISLRFKCKFCDYRGKQMKVSGIYATLAVPGLQSTVFSST